MLDIVNKKPKKSQAQKILDDIENNLRSLIKDKKEIWKKFSERQREFERLKKQYENNWEEAKKLVNKFILLWDYWNREVKILKLEKQMQAGVLPSERKELIKQINILNEYNETLEEGFKQRKIDSEIVTEIKKRLGIWEDEEEKIK